MPIAISKSRRGEIPTSKERAQFEAQEALERAKDKMALAERCKALGMKKRQVRAYDGTIQDVWMFEASYQRMGFQDHQIHAAERFGRDWETAYRGLRGQGFEPGVDGGKTPHGPHLAQVTAQTRLAQCRQYLGERSWQIVVAVVVHGATVTGVMQAARRDHRAVRADFERAFDDLDGFYTDDRKMDRTWVEIAKFNEDRAAMIAQAERGVWVVGPHE